VSSLERQCVCVIMGRCIFFVKKAPDSKFVYNSHPSTLLQSTTNMSYPHQCDEKRANTEEDGGVRKVREEKRVRKTRRFWRRLVCFHFSCPRAGKGGKAQGEKLEKDAETGPSSSKYAYNGALYNHKRSPCHAIYIYFLELLNLLISILLFRSDFSIAHAL